MNGLSLSGPTEQTSLPYVSNLCPMQCHRGTVSAARSTPQVGVAAAGGGARRAEESSAAAVNVGGIEASGEGPRATSARAFIIMMATRATAGKSDILNSRPM